MKSFPSITNLEGEEQPPFPNEGLHSRHLPTASRMRPGKRTQGGAWHAPPEAQQGRKDRVSKASRGTKTEYTSIRTWEEEKTTINENVSPSLFLFLKLARRRCLSALTSRWGLSEGRNRLQFRKIRRWKEGNKDGGELDSGRNEEGGGPLRSFKRAINFHRLRRVESREI